MTQEQHFDVASYALGVLDERDAARFEDHLIDCASCAVELESFIQVADILADVDADAFVATEQSRQDGLVLKKVIGEVKKERRRADSRRLYSLAAAVVVFAMLSIGALFAGGRWFAPDQQQQPTQAQSRGPDQPDPLPDNGDGPGIGGPELILPGEQMGSTDARSGVRLDAALEPKDWGTQVQFTVSNIKGPRICRLVAVRTTGASEVLANFKVGDKGWGTAANPTPPLLSAVTASPRGDIAHLQVQSVAPNGTTATLVTAP
jgi:hypothetical protein